MRLQLHQLLALGAALLIPLVSASTALAQSGDTGADPDNLAGRSMPGSVSPVTPGARESGSLHFPPGNIGELRARLVSILPEPEPSERTARATQTPQAPSRIGRALSLAGLRWDGADRSAFLHVPGPRGGSLNAVRIDSPGALAMRIGLRVTQLPDDLRLAFFSAESNAPVAPPVTGKTINQLIELNRASGDSTDAARTYWSPLVDGDTVLMVVYVPEGIDPRRIRFSVPLISHLFRDPLSGTDNDAATSALCATAEETGDLLGVLRSAASCNLDVSCYPGWSDEASALAQMTFTKSGNTYTCSGALINDNDPSSYIPYFLTANHCISTQTVASTLITNWFKQSSSCDSATRDSRYQRLTGGAQLLYQAEATDTSFLQLRDAPPGGVFFLGWTTSTPSSGESLTGIHHPNGDWKKISFGNFSSYLDCWPSRNGNFTCMFTTQRTGDFLDIGWQLGITESGSSGSPLINDQSQVVGQLYGGSSSCTGSGTDTYGRFDIAYQAGLSSWLSDTTPQSDDDHGDTCADATPLPMNASLSGSIESAGDADVFRLSVPERMRVEVKTEGSTDTYGLAYSANCNPTNYRDDDRGAGANFLMSGTVPAGTYYLEVSHFSRSGTGDYQVFFSGP